MIDFLNMRFILTKAIVILLLFSFADDAQGQIFRKWSKFKGKKHDKTANRVTLGFGLPYGGFFGINTEVGTKYVSLNAGLGYFPARHSSSMSTAGWSIGLRGYAMKPDKKIRFRMGIRYGVNGAYDEDDGFHVASGVSMSFGLEHRFSETFLYAMDFSMVLRGTNSYRPEDKSLEYGTFPSLGVGLVF